MKIKLEISKIGWWFWALTLLFITTAILGWEPGYYIVIAISAVQVISFYLKNKSVLDFDTQVRVVYFAFTLLGWVKTIRFPFFILLFLGTLMVVFFNRCGIAVFLKFMPWNKQSITKLKL